DGALLITRPEAGDSRGGRRSAGQAVSPGSRDGRVKSRRNRESLRPAASGHAVGARRTQGGGALARATGRERDGFDRESTKCAGGADARRGVGAKPNQGHSAISEP